MPLKAIEIRHQPDGVFGRVTLPKADPEEEFERGHFVKADDGQVTKLGDGDGDSADEFAGVCAMDSEDDKSRHQELLIYHKLVCIVPVASGQYHYGDPLQFDPAEERMEAASGNNSTIAWVYESDTGEGATHAKVLVDVTKLGGLFNITSA